MVGDVRWFNKFTSEVVNWKLYTTLLPPIRYLEKWKFYFWHCPKFAESNSAIPNSQTVPNPYSSLKLVVPR